MAASRMMRDVDSSKIQNALKEAFALNGFGDAGRIGQFVGAFNKEDVKEKSAVVITYNAAAKTTASCSLLRRPASHGQFSSRGHSTWTAKHALDAKDASSCAHGILADGALIPDALPISATLLCVYNRATLSFALAPMARGRTTRTWRSPFPASRSTAGSEPVRRRASSRSARAASPTHEMTMSRYH